jgi:hypothetical protein
METFGQCYISLVVCGYNTEPLWLKGFRNYAHSRPSNFLLGLKHVKGKVMSSSIGLMIMAMS